MQRKEKILQILESTDSQIIDFMNKASEYRENNLITYSKNIFIPLTEICKNDCGYCNFKKTPDDPSAIILKTKEEVLASLKEAEKYDQEEVLLTTDEDNIGSRKVIENNSGELRKTENGSCYYWIKIKDKQPKTV